MPPEHWQHYESLRRELLAAGQTRDADGLWGDKTDARLLWLHEYLTGVDSESVWQRWFAADAVATFQVLHRALWARPRIDRHLVLGRDLQFVATLKDFGLFSAADELLTNELLPLVGDDQPERFDLLLQAAEVHRRSYAWDRAGAALDAAGQMLMRRQAGGADAVRLQVQRAALLLARGLPDLAVPAVEAAERDASDPWLRAEALFVRLRLEHLMRRPQRAVAVLQEFLRQPVSGALADDPAWSRRLTQLRIRAALAVLADPEGIAVDAPLAVSWLAAAIADPREPTDERVLARMVWVTHRLDRGDVRGVAEQLDAAAHELPATPALELEERRLALATLALRLARAAAAPATELQARADVLDGLWRAFVERWHAQPASNVGEGPLYFADRRRTFVELLRSRLALIEDGTAAAEQVLRDVMRAQAVGSLAKELGAAAPDLATIRTCLCPPRTGLLVYVPGHEASVVIALDAASIAVQVLPVGTLRIDAAREELLASVQAVRAGDDPACLDAAARAATALLLPSALLGQVSHWRTLTVVGLEALGYLPFELLPGPDGQRLGLTHAITYLPSLPIGVWLAQQRPSPDPRIHPLHVRVVACPDAKAPAGAAEQPPQLPFGPAEAAVLAAGLAGTDVETRRGSVATAAAAFGDGGAVDFVQVIAHGLRDERRPDPQGLLFGDGRVLWPSEVGRSGAPLYLLLSACRAGRGRLRIGDDGRQPFSGAALLAGARAVVAPVLDVGYQTSLVFAADVHDGLWHRGLSLAEALRQARVAAMARGDASTCDAFLYHLVGLGEAPLAVPVPPWSGRWFVVVIALAALAGWLARKTRQWLRRTSTQ